MSVVSVVYVSVTFFFARAGTVECTLAQSRLDAPRRRCSHHSRPFGPSRFALILLWEQGARRTDRTSQDDIATLGAGETVAEQ